MIKNQKVSGTITIVIPFQETFSTNADDDAMYDYIEKNAMEYIEDTDSDSIRVLDVDIENIEIEEYAGDDEYGI